MQSRTVWIGLLLSVGIGVLAFWLFSRDQGPAPEPPKPAQAKVERSRKDRVERKLSMRADADPVEPVQIVGSVRDEAGKPIAGAIVLLTPKSFEASMGRTGERPQPVHVRSDVGGGFSIPDVPVGRYTVSASAAGYLTASHLTLRVMAGRTPPPVALVLQAGGHRVHGRVEDVSGGPVEGALVSVVRMDAQSPLRQTYAPSATLSNDDGAFAVTLPSGSYAASVTHPDYVTATELFVVTDGPRELNLRLSPGAVVEGVVKVRGSEAVVASAVVVAQPPSAAAQSGQFTVRGFGEHRVVADERGRFRLAGLPSGLVQLNAVADGHASAEVTEVSLGIAETASDVVVWVEPAFSISGFVVPRGSEGDEGIEGVWVGALSLQPPGLYVARQPSESDGFFLIPGVQPGNYMVAALGEDHLPNLTGTSAQVSDADVTDVLVELDQGVSITGRIEPPGPATVSLKVKTEGMGLTGVLSGVANALVRTRTDADGNFELKPVSPGSVEVVAAADDGSRGSLDVEVTDEGVADVIVEMEPRVTLEGVVLTRSGEPVAGAKVGVVRTDVDAPGPSLSFSVDQNPLLGGGVSAGEDGTFVAKGLEPGTYEVTVKPPKGPRLNFDDDATPPDVRTFTVPEGGLQGVRLVVEARDGEITGVVLDEDGAPMADAWVRATLEGGGASWLKDLQRAQGRGRGREVEAKMQDEPDAATRAGERAMASLATEPPVLTDAAGRFTISGLREGTYRVTAEAAGGQARVTREGVTVGSDLTLEVEALAGVEGRFTDGTKPVERYTLTLAGPTGRSKRIHNAQGRFSMQGLDPGTYTLEAKADAGVASAEVEVEEGSTADVDLSLESFATLSGTVTTASGEPISGLMVIVHGKDGSMDVGAGLKMLMGGGPKTDRRGKFEVGQVPPGEGRVMLMDPDGGEGGGAMANYEVDAGGHADLGTIIGVPAGEVPFAERGSLGLRTAVRDWTHRPLAPEADADDAQAPADAERERLWVRAVTEGGPAEAAGLQPGDEIIAVRDQDVAGLGPRAAASMLGPSHFKVGDTVALRILRDGSEERITIAAGKRDLSALGG